MPTNNGNIVKRTSQYLDNIQHDDTTDAKAVAIYGVNGANVNRLKVNDDGSLATTVVSGGGGTTNYATKIDNTTTANAIYIGNAALGSSGASAVWQIKRLNTAIIALDKTWADGDASFDNIWDNRASLTYL